MHSAAIGFGLGFFVALQLDPMSLLLWLGLRTIHDALRVRAGGEAELEVLTPRHAFVTSLAGTASNPLTIASWAAIFAVASTAGAARSSGGAILLVLGVTLGSLTCGSVLSSIVAGTRRAIGRRVVGLTDLLAGAAMMVFGALLAGSKVRDS